MDPQDVVMILIYLWVNLKLSPPQKPPASLTTPCFLTTDKETPHRVIHNQHSLISIG